MSEKRVLPRTLPIFMALVLLLAGLAVAAVMPLCAFADNEPHVHDGITFVAWTDELAAEQNGEGRTAANSQPSVPGYYYLTQNCTVTRSYANQWVVPAGTTHLCLNGYAISKNASGYGGRIIDVPEGATLHLYDETGAGKITGGGGSGSSSPWNGAGVCVEGGSLYLHGGTITGNYSLTSGSGVLVLDGEFVMTGGEISGNVLTYNDSNAGTVSVSSGATFTMTGGSIINNTQALESSCGVKVSSGATFNVAGNPVISGNGNLTNGGTERGLYLGTGCTVNIIGELSEDFCLPIFSQAQPTADNPIVLTSGLPGNGSIRNFANNRSSYGLRLNADGEVELAAVQLYDLWVGGQRLHESNAADLYGDGTVSYDPATNTLTLDNATITARGGGSDDSSYAGISYTGSSEQLNIALSGDSVVTGADSAREYGNAYGIRVYSGTSSVHTNLDISGAGSLRAVGGASAYQSSSNENSYGIFVHGDITVGEGCTVAGVGGSASGETYGVYANGNTWQSATQTYKEGNLIVSGTFEGVGGTAAHGDSYGICASGITVSGGTVGGMGGESGDYSFGISTTIFEISEGVLEGIGSSAAYESCGVYATTSGKVHGGTVTATGGSSSRDDTYGLYVRDTFAVDGGTVTATGGAYTGTSSSYGSYGIYVGNKVTVLSGGTVTATGGPSTAKSYGFYGSSGTTMTDGTLKAVGGAASGESYGINSITVNGGTAELIAGDAPTSRAASSLSLGSSVEVAVASPNSDGSHPVEYNGSDYQSYRYLKTGLAYNLWVGGKRVGEGNASDIFGDGTASYVGDNSAGTLTLNGANITGVDSSYEANIYARGIGLTIKLEGANTLSGGYYGIVSASRYVDGQDIGYLPTSR